MSLGIIIFLSVILLGIIVIACLCLIIINNQLTIMTTQERIDAALSSINDATNNIAADLVAIKKKLESEGVTPETLDALDAAAAKLQEVAASTPDEPQTEEV